VRFTVFSPDGFRVLTVSDDTARILDSLKGQSLLTLESHTGSVKFVKFSQDGRLILMASDEDRAVRVWDSQSGKLISVLTAPSDIDKEADFHWQSVGFNPGKSIVATNYYFYSRKKTKSQPGSIGTSGRLWDANTGKVLFTIEEMGFSGESLFLR
jgi:WD40 repeat protein